MLVAMKVCCQQWLKRKDTMADTPKYWKEYLEHIHGEYQNEYVEWAKAKARLEDKLENRPWWKKLWNDGTWDMFELAWRKPCEPEPSLVDYYDWDVNVRSKGNE